MANSIQGRARLKTEMHDADAPFLDSLDSDALFSQLLGSQAKAIGAVETAKPQLMEAISAALKAIQNPEARLIYCGAGTSGRVALLDGVELNPTFNWPNSRVHILVAGGSGSFFEAKEGAEDDANAAIRALDAISLNEKDIVLGLAASGTTPFVLSALDAANQVGAVTIGFSNNPDTPVLAKAKYPVLLETGQEALAGSTRLTAGTSQKIALNIFSTAVMVQLGKVYRGCMVDMRVTNAKLEDRAIRIIRDIVGCGSEAASAALSKADFDVKKAILVARGASKEEAAELLKLHSGVLAKADKQLEMDMNKASRPASS